MMEHRPKKWAVFKKVLNSEGGLTLVELMVTFLLLGILMTAAITTLSPAMNVMARISNMSRAQSVADILLEKICGEIGSSAGQCRLILEEKRSPIRIKKGVQ